MKQKWIERESKGKVSNHREYPNQKRNLSLIKYRSQIPNSKKRKANKTEKKQVDGEQK